MATSEGVLPDRCKLADLVVCVTLVYGSVECFPLGKCIELHTRVSRYTNQNKKRRRASNLSLSLATDVTVNLTTLQDF